MASFSQELPVVEGTASLIKNENEEQNEEKEQNEEQNEEKEQNEEQNEEKENVSTDNPSKGGRKKILTIQVILQGGDTNTIKVVMNDHKEGQKKEFELEDDSDKSFAGLTGELAKCLTTLQSVLPHKSSYFKGKDKVERALETTKEAQKEILNTEGNDDNGDEEEEEEEEEVAKEKGFNFEKVSTNMKEALKGLIKEKLQEEIDLLVEEALKKETDEVKRIYSKTKMENSKYLGKGLINKVEKDIFLTQDGIITDGIAIFPFKLDYIKDDKYACDDTYSFLWKMSNSQSSVKIDWIPSLKTTQEYEIASEYMKQFGTYQKDEIENSEFLKGVDKTKIKQNCDEGFDLSKKTLKDNMKGELENLIGEHKNPNKLDEQTLRENIIAQFKKKESKEPNETQLNYVLDILLCKGTKYLGPHKINSEENIDVYLTTDGIITDGYKVLPFEIKDHVVTDGYSFRGGYSSNWTLTKRYGKESQYYAAIEKFAKDKTSYGGSSNKTMSKRQTNNKTRRLY